MYFADRYDAAMQLASLLEKYRGAEGVILAVPRGGVPIGYYLAKHLGLPLDLLMTKKLGHPDNPEFAIGAVGLEDSIVEETRGVDQQYVQAAIENTRKQLQEKYKLFMGGSRASGIRTLSSYARLLQMEPVATRLHRILEEEKTEDELLTKIAEGKINPKAKSPVIL